MIALVHGDLKSAQYIVDTSECIHLITNFTYYHTETRSTKSHVKLMNMCLSLVKCETKRLVGTCLM